MITRRCPACHQDLDVRDKSAAGSVTKCPWCGMEETVATAPAADRSERVAAEIPPRSDDVAPSELEATRSAGVTPALAETLTAPAFPTAWPAPIAPAVPGYEILGELGRGGMGVVYKARQVKLKRIVALKMILGGSHSGSAVLERFKVEAEAVARIQHAGIVQIYEVGEHGGLPYFSLEYCPNGSLAGQLDGTPLLPMKAAALVEKVARTMHAAHQQRVVHRDLKPANILLAADGTPKVTDFGLAKNLDDDQGITASGSVMGTPSYMAPEQATGQTRQIGPTTDVYAMGAILYELLTGRPPFKGATAVDTIMQVANEEPVPPSRLQPSTPLDLETVCLKCLEKSPRRRYASAEELADDLTRFLDHKPVLARPLGVSTRVWRWCRRNAMVACLMASVVVALVGGTAFSAYFAVQAAKRASDAEEALRERDASDALRREAEANLRDAENRIIKRFIEYIVANPEKARESAQRLKASFLAANPDLGGAEAEVLHKVTPQILGD